MPAILFILVCLAAVINWMSIFNGWRSLETLSKPVVMVLLLSWLLISGGVNGTLLWFALGVLFSLLGDVFLMLPNERRWFLAGLGSFLLAHVCYILGLNTPPPSFSAMTFGVAIMVGVSAVPVIRRLLVGLDQKGLHKLVGPVRIYAAAISLMLFSALLTLFRTDWQSTSAYLVSLGALSFVTSDMLLAWNKFVTPVRRGNLLVMITYHLGQLALIGGAVVQFGK